MAWIEVTGGKRRDYSARPSLMTAQVRHTNRLYLDKSVTDLMGEPRRIVVSYDPESQRIRLAPTRPDDTAGLVITPDSLYSAYVCVKSMTVSHPSMIGDYKVRPFARGVELSKKATPCTP